MFSLKLPAMEMCGPLGFSKTVATAERLDSHEMRPSAAGAPPYREKGLRQGDFFQQASRRRASRPRAACASTQVRAGRQFAHSHESRQSRDFQDFKSNDAGDTTQLDV